MIAAAALLGALCAGIVTAEVLRAAPRGAWRALSSGLGLGSRAGAAHGPFAWDARLDARRDGDFGPLPGRPIDEPFAGVVEFEPDQPAAARR